MGFLSGLLLFFLSAWRLEMVQTSSTSQKTKAFRPQHFNGKFKIYEAVRGRSVGQWNWHVRRFDSSHIFRVFGQLHYLGSHAPKPINKKWRKVEKKFYERYKKYL